MVDVAIFAPPLGPQFRQAVAGPDPGPVLLQIDCGVSYTHSQNAQVAEHPIETGSTISDNRQVNRPRLKLDGINAARPIFPNQEGEATGLEHFDAYNTLRRLFEEGTVFDVATPLRFYEDMQLVSMSVPQNKDNSGVVEFSVELVEIRFVTSETVTLQPSPASKKAKSNRGKKGASDAPAKAAEGSRSALANFFTSERSATIAGN